PACAVNSTLLQTYGRHALRLSRVHEGSGYRVQRALDRLERGEGIKAAVVGGSVSNGHGMSSDGVPFVYGAVKDTWHKVVSSWLNETYGPQSFVNGAMAATDSSFFRYCWAERVRLGEVAPDLVFVELDVNDVADEASRQNVEVLVRSILNLPNKPAVLFVGAFALISLRGPLLPALMANHTLKTPWFNGDSRHIATPLHKALGDMVIAFLQEQRCLLDDADITLPGDSKGLFVGADLVGEVPPVRHTRLMRDKWDATVVHPSAPPTCRIAGSTLEPASPSPNWSIYSFREVKTYLETTGADRTIDFDVNVQPGSAGEIGVGYLRSPQYHLGRAKCRVGSQEKVLDGNWTRKASLTEIDIVATGLPPGTHRLVCTTLDKGKAFRIATVVSA
ncbi:hypothetical protein DMC30DRAFT_349685, partial [Rhodotorula diobovata]